MAKFMIKASYAAEGAKGLLKDGGSARRAAVEKATAGIGGRVESFHFAFGDADAYVIVDVPDTVSAIALSLAVNSSGTVRIATIPLITPEEVDAASHKAVSYRAPGVS